MVDWKVHAGKADLKYTAMSRVLTSSETAEALDEKKTRVEAEDRALTDSFLASL